MKDIGHTKWVRLQHYLRLSGESERTFRKLRAEGFLAEGLHYREDALKRLWVNTEAMTLWLEGQQLAG